MNCVWVEGKRRPKFVHREVTRAIKEAERLCTKEKQKVYVFALFNTVTLINGKLTWGGNENERG